MKWPQMPTLTAAMYGRLGGLMHDGEVERYEPTMRWARAKQISSTWRSHLAWHLANALGWRDQPSEMRGSAAADDNERQEPRKGR